MSNTVFILRRMLKPWWAKLSAGVFVVAILFGLQVTYTYLGYRKERMELGKFKATATQNLLVNVYPRILRTIPLLDTIGGRIVHLGVLERKNMALRQEAIAFGVFGYLESVSVEGGHIVGLLRKINEAPQLERIKLFATSISKQDCDAISRLRSQEGFRIQVYEGGLNDLLKHDTFAELDLRTLRLKLTGLTESQASQINAYKNIRYIHIDFFGHGEKNIENAAGISQLGTVGFWSTSSRSGLRYKLNNTPGINVTTGFYPKQYELMDAPELHKLSQVTMIQMHDLTLSDRTLDSVSKMSQLEIFWCEESILNPDRIKAMQQLKRLKHFHLGQCTFYPKAITQPIPAPEFAKLKKGNINLSINSQSDVKQLPEMVDRAKQGLK